MKTVKCELKSGTSQSQYLENTVSNNMCEVIILDYNQVGVLFC